jgi:hypothetical protein
MAPLGHTMPQTPHSAQRMGLISWRIPFLPVMAKTGQSLEHTVQPVQLSLILYAVLLPAVFCKATAVMIFLRGF